MPEPISIITSALGLVAKFWEKSLNFFIAVTIGCFLLAGASLLFIFLGFKDISTNLVMWFCFAGIVAGVFLIARLIEERRNRPFHLIADEQSSFFHLAKRADGNPGRHTQLSLHFRATNNLRGPLLLSKAKLIRPRARGAKIDVRLATKGMRGDYDSGNFIQARSTAEATAQIMLQRDVGDKEKLTVVLEVSDQRGSRERVKFKNLEHT
jgi:hypothetical protein